jgi:iron complex outermembrane recepter protein
MRLFLFLVFCFGPFFNQLLAQQSSNGYISGYIFTTGNVPAVNATVALRHAKDSSLAKASLPNEKGLFELEQIKTGVYFLSITKVGYQPYRSGLITLGPDSPTVRLPSITLIAVDVLLGEVKVAAKKPFIEQKLDRMIVNVENSIVAAGSTVLNVLERSPGVLVNEESSISLRGKQGVMVMIDGKPTPLGGTDLMNYLKSIPATLVEKIEIITNPSARYDAAGNAGIINIKFKKDQRQGLNGSYTVAYGQGVYHKPTASTNANYRKKKWNLFGNYATSRPHGFTRFFINRRFFNTSGVTESIFDQTTYIKAQSNNHNLKLGADFYASKKTVVGVMLSGTLNNAKRNGLTHSVITDAAGNLQYTTLTNNVFPGQNRNLFANANMKHSFDSTGKELTVDLDYGRFYADAPQDFDNRYYDPTGAPLSSDKLQTIQLGTIVVKSIKADYVHPMAKNSKLEAGFKISLVKTDNDIQFFTENAGAFVLDRSRSNHFMYDENVNAAYLNYSREFKKTDFQLGLRMEHTVTSGKQVTTGEDFSRNYLLLFPSIFINRKLAANHQLSVSYSRRIDRPSYKQLNPFKVFVDPYTYAAGDPTLRPVLTNSFELNYTLHNKYIASLRYVKSKATITDIFTQDDLTKISYQTPANLQDYEQVNLGLNIPLAVKKWMNTNIIASVYWNRYNSPLQGGQLRTDYTTWDINCTNNFTLGKNGWSAELSGFYQSKNAWGLFLIKNLAQISSGIQKTTKNKKSTFKIAVADMFYTNRIAVIVKYQNMDFFTSRTWDSRVLTVSYTHRFGKNTVARARQRNSGMEDEKRRAN